MRAGTQISIAILPRTKRSSAWPLIAPRTKDMSTMDSTSGASSEPNISVLSWSSYRGNGPYLGGGVVAQGHVLLRHSHADRPAHLVGFQNRNFPAWCELALIEVGQQPRRLALGDLGHPADRRSGPRLERGDPRLAG